MISELTAQVGSVTVSRPVFMRTCPLDSRFGGIGTDLLRMSLDENSA